MTEQTTKRRDTGMGFLREYCACRACLMDALQEICELWNLEERDSVADKAVHLAGNLMCQIQLADKSGNNYLPLARDKVRPADCIKGKEERLGLARMMRAWKRPTDEEISAALGILPEDMIKVCAGEIELSSVEWFQLD